MMGSAGSGWKETAEPIMPCGTAITRARSNGMRGNRVRFPLIPFRSTTTGSATRNERTGLAPAAGAGQVEVMSLSSAGSSRLTAVLGPTNTGKTYLAIERMLGHDSGMIGFPLRLLARENYDRIAKIKGVGQVALITRSEEHTSEL